MNSIKILGCRVYQKVMYIAEFFMPWHKAEMIKGAGSFVKIPQLLKKNNIDSVLIVTDAFLSEHIVPELIDALKKENVKYALYDGVVPNPTIQCIEDGLKIYKDNNCKGIVAVGGGSPMDCAKIIGARVVKPNKEVRKMKGLLKVLHALPPFIAVPTTAGTGSEVTLAAVISDPEREEKYPCNDPSLIPKFVVLDPKLTVGLPKPITSTTGVDALTHAVEAYIGHSNTKATKENAVKAIKLIFDNLYKAYENGEDIEARENMQEAAKLAGEAFTRAYVGYVHAIGHAFGAIVHMPHGLAMSVILPHILEAYGDKAYKKLAELADVVGIKGNSEEAKAKAFIQAIKDLNKKMDIPEYIGGKFAINDEQVKMIAQRANKEANPLYPCPKLFDEKELEVIVNSLREK